MTKPSYLRPPLGGSGIGDYSLHDFVSKWMMQQDDIAETAVFAEANARLVDEGDTRVRTVLLGDSITAFWDVSAYETPERRLINRGIPGQNSSQMLLRFINDVVALKPAQAAILCGTNDLRCYVGDPASIAVSAADRIKRNLTAMCDIAKANDIAVILSTLPPVCADRERANRDTGAIQSVNRWISDFAAARRYPVADYFTALADDTGHLPESLGEDGLHPSPAGYGRMWPALAKRLAGIMT